MKTIKVFIASSEELYLERLQFTDLIQEINRILKPRGIEVEPEKWEWLDDSMGPLHKQEEYNEVVKTCQMCLVLYWTKFGDYTKSELDTAYTELCAGRKPQKIYVYFKNSDTLSSQLQEFKDSFETNYGHFYCSFENVDTLRLRFLLQLERYINEAGDTNEIVKVRDSWVEVEGKRFSNLNNIPFAGNNSTYLDLLKDIEKAEAKVQKYPDDIDFRQELHDKKEKLQQMEHSLLQTAKRITELSTKIASERLSEAMQLFEQGNLEGANAVLNIKEIISELEASIIKFDAAKEVVESTRKSIEVNIDELLLKIDILTSELKEGWFEETISIYDKIINSSNGRVEDARYAELLYKYAYFLNNNNQYHLIGDLYDQALAIYRRLRVSDTSYEPDVAMTLNNIAGLHCDIQEFSKAENEYLEALEIRRRLAKDNPLAYEPDVAMTLNNIALLHSNIQEFSKAQNEYLEALETYRKLAKDNPQAYEPNVALTLNNIALLHSNIQEFSKAENEFLEALEIYKRLAEDNPQVYKSTVDTVLENISILRD